MNRTRFLFVTVLALASAAAVSAENWSRWRGPHNNGMANGGAPQVAYRETVSHEAEIDYTHKKQSGGSGQFARVKLDIEPAEAGAGLVFESKAIT